MLRSRYWSGLYSDQIGNALRHHFDEGADFETLLRQAGMAEQEPGSNMAQSLSVQNQDKLDTIMQQLGEMTSKMQDLENKITETEGFLSGQTQEQGTYASVSNHVTPVRPHTMASTTTKSTQFPGRCYACRQVGHKRGSSECPKTGLGKSLRTGGEVRYLVDSVSPSVCGNHSAVPEVVKVSSTRVDSTMSDDEPGVETDAHSSTMVNGPDVLGLVGPSSEVVVKLEGRSCQALLDTGSMVSTVTYSLSKQLKLPIHPMDHLIRVEGVGGHLLQYSGYVIAKVQMPDIDQEVEAMFRVVPDIGYNCATPVLIWDQCIATSSPFRFCYIWVSVGFSVKVYECPGQEHQCTCKGNQGLYSARREWSVYRWDGPCSLV